MVAVLGGEPASAQSSAGSLRCGAPSGSSSASSTAATAAAKKNQAKVDEFNAMQKQEQENQQAIQKAGDDILNGAKGSGKSDLDPNAPIAEPTADQPSTEPSATLSSGSVSAVNALLDTDTPASNSAAAVNSLLDDRSDSGAAPNSAAAVNSLLDDQSDTGTTPTAANAAVSAAIPHNPDIASDMQNSQDTPPSPAVLDTVEQETDVANPSSSVIANIQDGLQGLFSTVRSDAASVKATLSTLMNTPIGQMLSQGMPTTGPPPLATDTPEQMGSKSSGQAILGFGFFVIRPPWLAIDNYNTSNMNVVMPQLGYAAAMPDSGGQQ